MREGQNVRRVSGRAIGSLFLSFLAGGALSSGCGEEEPSLGGVGPAGAAVTIRFLRHNNPNYIVADRAFFDEYEAAHPNVKIEDTTVNFQSLAAALAGDLKNDRFEYDLVLIPPSRLCGFAANTTDVPPEVITLEQARELMFAAPLAGSTCGGRLKGLPVEYNLEYGGVVVNLDKYEAKFGRAPQWPDWPTFIAEAAMLTEYDAQGNPRANGLDIDPVWTPATWEILLSQILQRGGKYWTDGPGGDESSFDANEGDLFNFNTAEARASLTEMVGWITVNKVMFPELVPDKNTHVITRLASGAAGYGWNDPTKPLAVMGYLGTAGVPSARAELPPGTNWRFDYFPVPPMVGTEHRFVQSSGWSFAVPNTSKHPTVAWDIAKALALSPQKMRQWSAVTGALPALKENGSPSAAAAHPSAAKVQHLLERGQWIGYIPVGGYGTVVGAFPANFFAAAKGMKTIEGALADMEQTINQAILQHR